MTPTIKELSLDARLLLKRLQQLQVNETISYDELTKVIGRNVRPGSPGYYLLVSARRAAEREGVVVDVVRKEGLRRLDDVGIVQSSDHYISKVHRVSRRGAKRLTKVDAYEKLPQDAQLKHNLNLSLLGCLSIASSNKSIRSLERKASKDCLPTNKMLDALKDIG